MSYESLAVQGLLEMTERFGSSLMAKVNRYNTGESLVLQQLVFSHGASYPSELLEKAGTTSARIAAILKSLEKKGLIVREIDPDDRRKTVVTITEEGHQRAIHEFEEIAGNLWEVFHQLGKEDTEEFIRIIGRFFEVFVSIDADSSKPFAPVRPFFGQDLRSHSALIVKMLEEKGCLVSFSDNPTINQEESMHD
ncbi:MAG: MarR family transcriptional regulator [Coriobacteriia bacterium]|nr:MarR family transcriptional regulator [Coriobacteriia bacterium]